MTSGEQFERQDLFRWYLARIRRQAEQRAEEQKLTPMALVERDKARIQELIERSGKARAVRTNQILDQLRAHAESQKSLLNAVLNRGKLLEQQHSAMATMLVALDQVFDSQQRELSLDNIATLLVQQLEAARQGERLIADSSRHLLCALDKNALVTDVNLEFEVTSQYQKFDLLAVPIKTFLKPSERERFESFLSAVKHGTARESLESVLVTRHGELVDLEWHIEWSETAGSFFCLAENITERKEKERFKADVTSMVSHDLRVPVSGVALVLENVESGIYGQLNDAGLNKLAKAREGIERMTRLIDEMLDAEKLEAGEMTAEVKPFTLAALYEHCGQTFRDQEIQFPADSNLTVRGDFDHCCRILLNLLSNAVKYSPAPGTIKVQERQKAGAVQILVQDAGTGVAEDLQANVFARYRSSRGGTGLGLYISKKLVELQGGEIGFESRVGEGSTFWFRLPQDTPSIL